MTYISLFGKLMNLIFVASLLLEEYLQFLAAQTIFIFDIFIYKNKK